MSRCLRAAVMVTAALLTGTTAGVAEENGKLAYLIPNLFGPSGLIVDSEAVLPTGQTHSAHFNSAFQAEFSQLNIALVSQLASVPLPSPASGYTYRFDPEAGVFVRSTGSFGPILAERGETIGRGRVSLGFSYQKFSFDTLEGQDLSQLRAVFTHDSPATGGRDDVVTTVNSIRLKVQQFTTYLTFGIASRVDLSVALPMLDMDIHATSDATVQRIGTSGNPRVHFFRDANGNIGNTRRFDTQGDAHGIGDVLVRLKARALARGGTALAIGADVRLPTGDEQNLLGSGAVGVRPFLVFSSVHRASPHLDLGFQWNGKSVLAGDLISGSKDTLPHQAMMAAGVDVQASKRLTLAFDVLGRRTLDSPRLQATTFTALDNRTTFPDMRFERGSFNTLDAAAGFKWNPVGTLLVDANVRFKLNSDGLRDKVAPLLGLEYSF